MCDSWSTLVIALTMLVVGIVCGAALMLVYLGRGGRYIEYITIAADPQGKVIDRRPMASASEVARN